MSDTETCDFALTPKFVFFSCTWLRRCICNVFFRRRTWKQRELMKKMFLSYVRSHSRYVGLRVRSSRSTTREAAVLDSTAECTALLTGWPSSGLWWTTSRRSIPTATVHCARTSKEGDSALLWSECARCLECLSSKCSKRNLRFPCESR